MDGDAAGDGVDELAACRVFARPHRPQPLGQLRVRDRGGHGREVAHTVHSPNDGEWFFFRKRLAFGEVYRMPVSDKGVPVQVSRLPFRVKAAPFCVPETPVRGFTSTVCVRSSADLSARGSGRRERRSRAGSPGSSPTGWFAR